MEIGSEFWLSNNSSPVTNNKAPFWLKKHGDVTLTMSGRGAISLLLDQVDLKAKKVMMPSYICESVILPFKEENYEITYYKVDNNFRPVDLNIIKEINEGIFFHMGYYGFQTNKELRNVISHLKKKSVIVVEDVTHTLFSNYQDSFENDFTIGSVRKWFGTPSGGFISSKRKINVNLDIENNFIELRKSSLQQKTRYISSKDESMKSEFLSGFEKAEVILDNDTKAYHIDQFSENIINNIDYIDLINSRRKNYEFLFKHLNNIEEIDVIFTDLEDGTTPMFFPIYIKDRRDELRHYLIKKEIYCPIHWPISSFLIDNLDSETDKIYNTILSLPCDQRYNEKDMSRIVKEIHNFFK